MFLRCFSGKGGKATVKKRDRKREREGKVIGSTPSLHGWWRYPWVKSKKEDPLRRRTHSQPQLWRDLTRDRFKKPSSSNNERRKKKKQTCQPSHDQRSSCRASLTNDSPRPKLLLLLLLLQSISLYPSQSKAVTTQQLKNKQRNKKSNKDEQSVEEETKTQKVSLVLVVLPATRGFNCSNTAGIVVVVVPATLEAPRHRDYGDRSRWRRHHQLLHAVVCNEDDLITVVENGGSSHNL